MTDIELLELAAKAAGYDAIFRDDGSCKLGSIKEDCTYVQYWNPITDDGDALRLVHKLGLLSDVPGWPRTLEETRRVIVREAAALVTPNTG